MNLSPRKKKMNKAKGFMQKVPKNMIQKMKEDHAGVEKKALSPFGQML